ncbi:MAG: citrate/2-methylcitrate synthase [Thermoprotei archaeon]
MNADRAANRLFEEFILAPMLRAPMSSESVVIHKGLDNVYVCESKICYIDGENSKLYYRGYSIEDLVARSDFSRVAYLLLKEKYPTKTESEQFAEVLKRYLSLPSAVSSFLEKNQNDIDPMDSLRTSVSLLGGLSKNNMNTGSNSLEQEATRLVGSMPALVPAVWRSKKGERLLEPRDDLNISANFLYLLLGKPPSEYEAKIMDTFMTLHAEHDLNASTFACMVTASTLSDVYSSVISGIGALKGPLHGGANVAALRFIRSVGDAKNADKAVEETLKSGQRIMGFGHRIYKNYDPRYKILKKIAGELAERTGRKALFETAQAIETAAAARLQQHGIYPNVDFYSGVVLSLLGIEPELFTPVFAMSRTVGWVAHVLEYTKENRLIRPKARYIGSIGLEVPAY